MDKDEKAKLVSLIKKYKGNLSAIARHLEKKGKGITRQGLSVRMKKFSLEMIACSAREKSGIPGPRISTDAESERENILKALAESATYEAARASLRMSRRTLYRKISKYEIKLEKVMERREEILWAAD